MGRGSYLGGSTFIVPRIGKIVPVTPEDFPLCIETLKHNIRVLTNALFTDEHEYTKDLLTQLKTELKEATVN